jgi:FSR family fosmidomycin resistance protein-like MFS transporter
MGWRFLDKLWLFIENLSTKIYLHWPHTNQKDTIMNATTAAPLQQDARVIGLVGLAHSLSHFYHLILAALFPWIKVAFDLSYAQLGLLMTAFFVVSGLCQAASGFLVDRVGALRVLCSGLGLLSLAALVLAGASAYPMLLAGSMLAGLGNGVFHPSDYTILNQRVSKARLPHAFSVHGITGNLGWAAAPIFLAGLATLFGWRVALLAAAVLPAAVVVLLFLNRASLYSDPRPVRVAADGGTFDFIFLPSVWMIFGYFFLTALALGAIQGFSTSSLVALYDMSLGWANTAYTAFMVASAGGTVLGGFLAVRSSAHDRTIAATFTMSALIALLLAAAVVTAPVAVVLMALIGMASGIASPSRDLLIRAAAPVNATGRVYGVVYSGLDIGLASGPLLFGMMMDANHPSWVFICVALFQFLAIGTAITVGGKARAKSLQAA